MVHRLMLFGLNSTDLCLQCEGLGECFPYIFECLSMSEQVQLYGYSLFPFVCHKASPSVTNGSLLIVACVVSGSKHLWHEVERTV